MTAFLLTWKEGILFASLIIFLFTPWSRSLRRYILLGLFVYLLNKPLISNFHPGDIGWWLGDPAAWITAATWLGALVLFVRWLQGIKDQGVWSALSEVSWSPHLIANALIISALFLFHLPEISPHFKTQQDYSFSMIVTSIPLQYFIGSSLLRSYDETMQSTRFRALTGVLLCVLLVSLVPLYGTIAEYRALLGIAPSKAKAVELIERWETVLKRNKATSIGTIRSTAYGRIGDLKLSLADGDGARQWYKMALRNDPDDVAGSIGLARLLLEKEGKTWKVKKAFQGVIEQNPSLPREGPKNFFPPLQFREMLIWGEALEEEGKQKEALTVYTQALRMRPDDPKVNLSLGKIYLAQGDYEAAITAFKETLVKWPRHLYALSSLVDIYEKEGEMDLAQKYQDIIMKEVVTHRILRPDWQGRAGGNLYWNAGCYARIKLYRGRVKFRIQAMGSPAQGTWPHMVVKLDKKAIGETDVTSKKWEPYTFSTNVQTGEYTFWVYFSNDFYLEKKVGGKEVREDRNLFVGDAAITY